MVSATMALTASYDYGEVARSILIAIAASYAALDLAGRVTAATGRARAWWLTGGAIAMGIGIWAMHLKGMLAFHLPVAVVYYWPTVLLSLVVAILASALALYFVSRQQMGRLRLWTGSLILGGGIAGLHYIGMSAMRLAAMCQYSAPIVALSIVLAIVFSFAALALAFDLREETKVTPWRKIGSAVVMGAAISAMHYTAMAAASFVPTVAFPDLAHTVSISPLTNNGIVVAALLVLGAAILTSAADRRLAAQAVELERRVAERTSQLTALNQRLAESEERFRLAEQAGRMFAYEWNAATDVIAFSAEAAQILGIEDGSPITGQQMLTKVHPDDRERLRVAVAGLSSEKPHLRISYRKVGPDGSVIWLDRTSQAHFDEQGKMLRIVGMVADITERKNAEEALRDREEKFHQIADTIHEIFWMVDADTKKVIYVNPAFEQVTGRSLASLQEAPLSYRDIIHPEDRIKVLGKLDETVKAGRLEVEFRITRPDGTIRWVEALGFPVRDAQGNIYRLAGVVQDITERRLAEESLHQAQAELAHVTRAVAMGELVASIAHEVNQPLTAVVSTSNYALRELASGKPNLHEVKEAMKEIAEDANRISSVISQLRAMLKKGATDRVELNINDVIQEVTMLVRNEAALNHVQVQLDLAADLPPVVGDRVQLQQVLINLAMNGIDAMHSVSNRPRRLAIKSEKHADGISVQVQDSGTGLETERIDRIFDPFFTTKPQGIGMGLSISRSIIESHGGRLQTVPYVEGAIFQFTLPTMADRASENSAA